MRKMTCVLLLIDADLDRQIHQTISELAMRVCVRLSACVCKSTPITADVTVTKIAGYVRVRILMNR